MKARILDQRDDDGNKCYLCAINLEDYINHLAKRYSDYEIQREIVSNIYLDRLVDTVLNRRHIPPIVLVVESGNYTLNGCSLQVAKFNILDGLQRTHRLKIIHETLKIVEDQLSNDAAFLSWSSYKLSRYFSDQLETIESSIDVLKSIVDYKREHPSAELKDSFLKNIQWFEIWTDLTPDQEVEKMLVLNAGHKPVKTRHQLELLFLNLLPLLGENSFRDFTLIREKKLSSTQYSKSRHYGQFHFAHVIAALLSLAQGKPVTTSTNLVQNIQEGDSPLSEHPELVKIGFLRKLVGILLRIDKALENEFGQQGTLWLGREIALTGLFGAVGAYATTSSQKTEYAVERLASLIEDNPSILNLQAFEEERNNLNLSLVNIGNVNKTAVFKAILTVLSAPSPSIIDWQRYFKGGVE